MANPRKTARFPGICVPVWRNAASFSATAESSVEFGYGFGSLPRGFFPFSRCSPRDGTRAPGSSRLRFFTASSRYQPVARSAIRRTSDGARGLRRTQPAKRGRPPSGKDQIDREKMQDAARDDKKMKDGMHPLDFLHRVERGPDDVKRAAREQEIPARVAAARRE
jgi:hypothetical protein